MSRQGKKFGRVYRLTIDMNDGSDPIIVMLPFTIQFTVNRMIHSSLNTCYVDIYNLSSHVRDLIFQEQYTNRNKTLTLEAGYDTLCTIYTGTIFNASSRRDRTDIVTSIECLSGSWDVNTATVYQTLNKGTTLGDMYKFLIGQFPTLELGACGKFEDKLARPVTLNGNVWDLLKRYSNGQVFIDNGRVYVLRRNEVVAGEVGIVSSETGLLDTPERSDGYLHVHSMFEPDVRLGQDINLTSSVMPIYNGTYAVYGIQHTGIISDSVAGDCRTVLDLFTSNLVFETVAENGQ